jgi:hypothetical protein
MEYKNEQLGASFTVPDKITVRQQLAYYSEAALAFGDEFFIRLWKGATALIQDWQCADVPLTTDIETDTNPKAASVMIWAGMRVKEHIDRLETVPKNS